MNSITYKSCRYFYSLNLPEGVSSGETFLKGTEKLPQVLNPIVTTQYNKQTEQQQLGKFDNTAELVNMYTELNQT